MPLVTCPAVPTVQLWVPLLACPAVSAVRMVVALGLLLGLTGLLQAEDVVRLGGKAGQPGLTTLRGTVLEYTGRELKFQTGEGRIATFPGDRVRDLQSEYTASQVAADKLFAARKYREAYDQYGVALRGDENRAWARRQILAQQIWCLRQLDQWTLAAKTFLALQQSDPETPYIDCIPLVWIPTEPSPSVEREALNWLGEERMPVERLLGASCLLGQSIPEARAALNKVSKERIPSLAWLATTQLWRLELTTVDVAQLERWEQAVEKAPPAWQAGPWCVLAQGWELRQQPERAALCWLRVPILHRRDRQLSATALERAGLALEAAQQPAAAQEIYREIVRDYSDQAAVKARAQARLQQLDAMPGSAARS